MQVNSVAIIGAGPGGLTAAKEAKACGLNPTIFEKGKTLGGQWSAEGSVWVNMKLNNSRNSSSFSDHPWKENSPDFPNRLEVYEYLFSYATAFRLHACLKLNSEVTHIKKKTNGWRVKWINENEHYKYNFDYVIVCSGLFSKAYRPTIPGIKSFTGTLMHSSQYKNPNSLEGKSVAIIGNSDSGCEIAVDVASVAKKTIHIFRKAVWITPRYVQVPNSDQKVPFDHLYSRSKTYSASQDHLERNQSTNAFLAINCKRQSEISPELEVIHERNDPPFITTSDEYLPLIEKNKIFVEKGFIRHIEEDTISLSNETSVKVDTLIFCTGYRTYLPFFDEKIKKDLNFDDNDTLQPLLLYQGTLHPTYPELAFVGLIRIGVYFGTLEMQARLATQLFSKKIAFPSPEKIKEALTKELEIKNRIPRPKVSRGFITFSDELAKEIDSYPDSSKIDQALFNKVWNGPFTSSSFRLIGFDAKEESSKKTIDQLDKIIKKENPFVGTS